LALAFAENAFRDVTTPEEFYSLKVPVDRDIQRRTLEIKIKDSMLDVPPGHEAQTCSTFDGKAKAFRKSLPPLPVEELY
jgi:hypothetical protein